MTSDADPTATEGPAPSVPKSLVIALDGVRPDALAAAHTPALDSLIDGSWAPGYGGAFTDAARTLTDADTSSGPNHWAIMTGATGSQHGVVGNADVDAGDSETFPHYLSLLERDDPARATAYLFTWGSDVAIPCEADFILHGNDAVNATRVANILAGDYADDNGLFGTVWEAGTDPDAVFLFLDDIDGAGHAEGFSPAVPTYITAIERADAQLSPLLTAIREREQFADERWQIVVTTDHGGEDTDHGGNCEACERIFFLVSSPLVRTGTLPAYDPVRETGARNLDVVPTALSHMNVDVPAVLTGTSRHLGAT